jgi:hypothetical protein
VVDTVVGVVADVCVGVGSDVDVPVNVDVDVTVGGKSVEVPVTVVDDAVWVATAPVEVVVAVCTMGCAAGAIATSYSELPTLLGRTVHATALATHTQTPRFADGARQKNVLPQKSLARTAWAHAPARPKSWPMDLR